MASTDVSRIRLITQHILYQDKATVKELVAWMGAMQAQDFRMVKWAIGVRLAGSTEKIVEKAMDSGEIIRTHLMRPTWHLVSADDIRWLLDLTAPRIKASLKSRHRDLEINNAVLRKSNSLLINALKDNNHLTRDDLVRVFEKEGIPTGDNRASHLLLFAELDGLICSGVTKGRNSTYALLDERVPPAKKIARAEALALLARKYFSSHGPATLQDFIWWSGMPVGDARNALEMIKSDFVPEKAGEAVLWMPPSLPEPIPDHSTAFLLPAYDEFIISYKDRSALLSEKNTGKAVSSNGIFRPVIVVNGKVAGLWSRSYSKSQVKVETQFFIKPEKQTRTLIDSAIHSYESFYEG
jgi:hypothetical protein